MRILSIFVFGLVASLPSLAQADLTPRFSLFTLGTFSHSTSSSALLPAVSVSGDPKLGVGGGAGVELSMLPMFSVEVDAIYLTRTQTVSLIESSYSYLQFPVLARLRPLPFLSVGLGPYYGMAVGDIRQKISSGASSVTYDVDGTRRSDFGIMGALGGYFPIVPGMSLFAEGRYGLGLLNIDSNPNTTEKWTDIQILLGFQIGL